MSRKRMAHTQKREICDDTLGQQGSPARVDVCALFAVEAQQAAEEPFYEHKGWVRL